MTMTGVTHHLPPSSPCRVVAADPLIYPCGAMAPPEGAVGRGGSNCGGRQHCVVEVKKEGDDASPPSSSAFDRSGGEEERGAVVVGSY